MADGVQITLTPRQADALAILRDPATTELLYGGARGGGKTVLGCLWGYERTCELIDRYGLGPSQRPMPIGLIVRAKGRDIEDTILPSWCAMIPRQNYEIRGGEGKREIVVRGAASILLRGCEAGEHAADQRQKFRGMEVCWVWLEQAEEVSRDDAGEIRLTTRRKIGGQDIAPKRLFTANPAQGWLRDDFIVGNGKGRRFLRAKPSDNPMLSADYVRSIKEAYAHRPDILAAYLDGSWDAMSRPDQVILDAWIDAALHRQIFRTQDKNWLSCDPALYGDDECVIYRWHNGRVVEDVYFGQRDAPFVANKLHTMAITGYQGIVAPTAVAIDTCGLGGPIADMLTQMSGGKYDVIRINSAEAATEKDRYYNRRAEVWDHVARILQSGDIDMERMDDRLRSQLCTPTYKLRNGKILIESKADIKARIGCSPDRADCWVYGVWAWQFVEEAVDKLSISDTYGGHSRRNAGRQLSWMAM